MGQHQNWLAFHKDAQHKSIIFHTINGKIKLTEEVSFQACTTLLTDKQQYRNKKRRRNATNKYNENKTKPYFHVQMGMDDGWAWTTATRSYPASLADISNQTPHPQILAEKQLHIKLILKLIHFQAKVCRVTQTKEERVC